MPKTVYSAETKAAAMAALLEGQAISKVASDFRVPSGTVKAWSAGSRLLAAGAISAAVDQVGTQPVASDATQKKEEIGRLLLEYLRTNLETLQTQSVIFRDPVWLARQSAEGAAVLHGVLTDKTIRLLEALSAATGSL